MSALEPSGLPKSRDVHEMCRLVHMQSQPAIPETRPPPCPQAELSNAFWFATFNALSYPIILSSPMILFAKSLNASATVLGIVAGMMPLLVIFQIPAASHVVRIGYRRFVYTGWGVRVSCIFVIALIPLAGVFLSPETQLALLLTVLFCFNLSRGISSAAWLPWITTLVPEHLRGRFLAREATLVSLANFVTLALAALCLGRSPAAWRFSLLFLISAAMGTISLRYLKRIPDAPVPEAERKSTLPVPWRAIAAHPPLRRFLWFNLAWSLAYGGLGAFTVAYLKVAGGMSEDRILLVTGLAFLGGLAGLWWFRSRIDQFGSKPIITFCLGGWTLIITGWLTLSTGLTPLSFPKVLGLELAMGLGFTLVNINLTRLAMTLSPVLGRSHFFALYSVVANLSMGLSPVLWGLAMDAVGDRVFIWQHLAWTRYSVFFTGVLGSFLVCLILSARLVEPRSGPLDRLLRDLLIISPQRALLRLWRRPR
jgi:MFS family permease